MNPLLGYQHNNTITILANVYFTQKHANEGGGGYYLWHCAVKVLNIKDLENYGKRIVLDALLKQVTKICSHILPETVKEHCTSWLCFT